jgi:uncharacterized coiled-coil protein SlyX
MLSSRSLLPALVFAPALMCCFSARATAQEARKAFDIEQLKKRIAEQDRRIARLETQVQDLIAAMKKAQAAQLGETPPAIKTPSVSPPHRSRQTAGERSSEAVSNPGGTAAPPPVPASANHPPGASSKDSTATASSIKVAGISVGGDVYLYQFVPLGVPGAQPKFELYAFSAQLSSQKGPWDFYMDYRFRTTKLRSFFPGNTWLQQGYVGYRTSLGEIKAGSFYRRVGLDWDGSFFGNIQYFDGLKLDPEFGIGFEGTHAVSGKLGVEYSVQYFTADARINGSLPGRDFVSETGARAKNDGTIRFAPVWHFNDDLSLTVGGSYARGTIERDGGPNNTRSQYAADATLQWRGLLTYAEVLNQSVDGVVVLPPQDATYTLFGARWTRGRFQPRLNYSAGNYHGFMPRREYILQPGITIKMHDGFAFLYEFDYWKRTSVPTPFLIDKSLNFVLLYHF